MILRIDTSHTFRTVYSVLNVNKLKMKQLETFSEQKIEQQKITDALEYKMWNISCKSKASDIVSTITQKEIPVNETFDLIKTNLSSC